MAKPIEVECLTCDGSGLLPTNNKATWNVTVCNGCNGAGKIMLADKKPIAYDINPKMLPQCFTSRASRR
jgi:DnaJ-class molecular chaperone